MQGQDGDIPYGIYQNQLGADPSIGSSYIQVVTWSTGNPDSPYYADQTELFSHKPVGRVDVPGPPDRCLRAAQLQPGTDQK
jgi:hypothetical protein